MRSEAPSREDDLAQLVSISEDVLDTDDEAVDPSFDLDSSMKSDVDHLEESLCEEWVSHLKREDRVSLGLFLCFQLSKHFNLGEIKAAELSGMMVGRSDKTVREWRKQFLESGEVPESKQGKYQRSEDEDEGLKRESCQACARKWQCQRKPNLTVGKFC